MSNDPFKDEGIDVAEVVEFCDTFRRAAGFDGVPELIAGIPSNKKECLIARTINCRSSVIPHSEYRAYGHPPLPDDADQAYSWWVAELPLEVDAPAIAKALNDKWPEARYLGLDTEGDQHVILLPPFVGATAQAFDDSSEKLGYEFVDRWAVWYYEGNGDWPADDTADWHQSVIEWIAEGLIEVDADGEAEVVETIPVEG